MATARKSGAEARLVDGEFPFTAEDFRRIASMLHADAGIALVESKATLVYARLAKRLRALGLESFRDYCHLVARDEGIDERQKMLAALTTNVTRFYREPHHFEHLKTHVLPGLIATARRGGRVRLWSAACSSGQEPYTMALCLLALAPDAAEMDIKILATDIDPNILAEAREGVYRQDLVEPVPSAELKRWFEPADQRGSPAWRVSEEVAELVSFRELNLNAPTWPMKQAFQVIFCRNVAIYFEDDTQAKLWSRFAEVAAPDGRLYIGHSERVNGPASARWRSDGLTSYRLTGARA